MTIKEIKTALLRKGWAGKTISRKETAQRLNILIEESVKLKHSYSNLHSCLESESNQEELESLLKNLRLDIGKLKEVVFSCGETAFNGTSLEPESFRLPCENALSLLRDYEDSFRRLLDAEQPVEHHLRTEAVLRRLHESSNSRLSFIRLNERRTLASSSIA